MRKEPKHQGVPNRSGLSGFEIGSQEGELLG